MYSRWGKRLLGVVGVVVGVGGLAWLSQSLATGLGSAAGGAGTAAGGSGSATAIWVGVAAATFAVVTWPLYQARPRRTLTRLSLVVKRSAVGVAFLGGFAYAGLLSVPSPSALVVLGSGSVVVLFGWFSALRRWTAADRAVVVGNDPAKMAAAVDALSPQAIGYLSPTTPWVPVDGPVAVSRSGPDPGQQTSGSGDDPASDGETEPDSGPEPEPAITDGGGPITDGGGPITDGGGPIVAGGGTVLDGGAVDVPGAERIAGLSRLRHVLRERDVDTVAVAFDAADREEFFGVLRTCHDLGIDVLAHDSHADSVLVAGEYGGELVEVDLEPWPWYSRLVKRTFDVCFALVGLFALAPLMWVIGVAIKLDSPGPMFYGQTRTAELGATFEAQKFRTMLPESEDAEPECDAENDRITRVGRVLRKTHMDEIPQLLSILWGEMSVVGPRAVWTDEEAVLMEEVQGWPKRWAITPGLTGLAQVRGVDSTDGDGKLGCDLEYIDRQSLLLDIWIVALQLWSVARDCFALVTNSNDF